LNKWKALWIRCGWLKHPHPSNHKSGEAALRVLQDLLIKHHTFDVFIPIWKTIPEDSIIYKSWAEGVSAKGVEKLELGGLTGIFKVQVIPTDEHLDRKQLALFENTVPRNRHVDVLITRPD